MHAPPPHRPPVWAALSATFSSMQIKCRGTQLHVGSGQGAWQTGHDATAASVVSRVQIYDAYIEDQERQAAAEEQSSRPRVGGRKGGAAGGPTATAADDAARRVRISRSDFEEMPKLLQCLRHMLQLLPKFPTFAVLSSHLIWQNGALCLGVCDVYRWHGKLELPT